MLHTSKKSTERRSIRGLLSTIMCCLFAGSAQAVTYRTVAMTGTQAPGAPVGVVYGELSFIPEINDLGQVAFNGELTGPGVDTSNDNGIWSEGGGTLHLIAP